MVTETSFEGLSDVVTVPEEKVKTAIKQLILENKLIVEGAGALSGAAAIEMPEAKRGRTVCLVTGGNIDLELLSEIIAEK